MNYKMIRYILGVLLAFEAGFMLVPLITAAIAWESEFFDFLISAGICLAIGALLAFKKPKNTTLYAKEGFVIVSLSWIVLSLFGGLPLILTGSLGEINSFGDFWNAFVNAFFEMASGFTTTGSSIFESVEQLSYSVKIWRCFSHWVGGMGVLVFIMAFMPLAGGQNMHIMKAESPGPDVSKLVPRVKKTALILYGIYFGLTVLTFISYWIVGSATNDLTFFEAVCHTFSTAGTGGFGIKNDSCASMAPALQWVMTITMLIFAINFNSYYLILKRKWRDALNAEVRAFIFIVLSATTIIFVNIYSQISALDGINSAGDAIRQSAFYVASLISTTGYATVDYNLWPTLSHVMLMLVLFVGACAGSTGGGVKVSRIVIFIKGLRNEINKLLHPRQVKRITMDKKPVDGEVVRSVNAFLVAYGLIFITSVALVSIDAQNDIVTSVSAVMTALSNVGPGLGGVGPVNNFAHLSNFSKLVLSFDMLAGRLELFPMLVLFSPSTYKNKGF